MLKREMADYLTDSVYGLLLLPDPAFAAACIEASTLINQQAKSVVSLSTATPPHITVGHLVVDEANAIELYESLRPHEGMELEGGEIYARVSQNMYWAWLAVSKTAELMTLHKRVIAAAPDYQADFFTPQNKDYPPHVTLARLLAAPAPDLFDNAVAPQRFTGYPALARMGEHGVITQIVRAMSF